MTDAIELVIFAIYQSAFIFFTFVHLLQIKNGGYAEIQ
jgi:hypothetical protein